MRIDDVIVRLCNVQCQCGYPVSGRDWTSRRRIIYQARLDPPALPSFDGRRFVQAASAIKITAVRHRIARNKESQVRDYRLSVGRLEAYHI